MLLQRDFQTAFDEVYPVMSAADTANLLFMDQYGVCQITEDVFARITKISPTDFLFFVSSSTIRRFADHPAIQKYLGVDEYQMRSADYYDIHRALVGYYRSLLPPNKLYYLAPFSIKEGANIYGLIFGSGHVLGMEKFLYACWNEDPERGEANYDIDHE